MKKFYQLITTVSISLLTIGTNAQAPATQQTHPIAKPISSKDRFAKPNPDNNIGSTKRAMGTQNALIDYVNGDELLNSSGKFYYWTPVLALNSAYTSADSGKTYNLLSNTAYVTYDTVFDFYTNFYVTPIGGITVDTIYASIQYHNTSNTNDTLVYNVCAVNGNGYPNPSVVYGSTMFIVNPSTFSASGNTLDSLHFIYMVKSITIPKSARHGYNFSISVTVKGSKLDTVALTYYSQGMNNCSSFGLYTPAPTSMGVADGAQRNVNSFVSGLYHLNDLANHGTNTPLFWPDTAAGQYQGWCLNGGKYYWSPLPLTAIGNSTCTGDTSWFLVQNIAIYPAVSVSPAGINTLTAYGFEVSQNCPNPFNAATQITYSVTKSSDVVFSLYDMAGRILVNNIYSNVGAGKHVISLNANQFNPGVYFYSFNINGNSVTRKMIITQ